MMYVLLWRSVYALTRVLFWCLFPSLLRNSGNKHQNNPSRERINSSPREYIHYSIYDSLELCWLYPSTSEATPKYMGHYPTVTLQKPLYINKHIEAEKNGQHFPGDIFKRISSNENVWILNFSLTFVSKDSINNIAALARMMAWRWPSGKALFEPMIFSLPTHICVTRSEWINPCFA